MVSDWSGAALEYAFGLERPVLFVDVPRKVNNPEYERLGIEPFEASVREQIGRVVAPERARSGARARRRDGPRARPSSATASARRATSNIFNVGTSGASRGRR